MKKALQTAILAWKDAGGKQITLDPKTGEFVFPQDIQLTTDIKGAVFNYTWSTQSPSATVHNFKRAAGLMQVAIEKLTGKPLAKATLLYSK